MLTLDPGANLFFRALRAMPLLHQKLQGCNKVGAVKVAGVNSHTIVSCPEAKPFRLVKRCQLV